MKEKTLQDFMNETFSEMAVKKLFRLPLKFGDQVDIRIGEESAGIIVLPPQSDIFSADGRSISTDIVIFTSVEGNRVWLRGWQRTPKLIAIEKQEDGEILGTVSELEPIESLQSRFRSLEATKSGVPVLPTHSARLRDALPVGAGADEPTVLESDHATVLAGLSAESFPSGNATDEECRGFAVLACKALPEPMLARLVRHHGAFLWITKFADGVIFAEPSTTVAEPWMAERLWQKPGAGEIAVALAFAEVPSNHAGDYDQIGFWQGMVTIKANGSSVP